MYKGWSLSTFYLTSWSWCKVSLLRGSISHLLGSKLAYISWTYRRYTHISSTYLPNPPVFGGAVPHTYKLTQHENIYHLIATNTLSHHIYHISYSRTMGNMCGVCLCILVALGVLIFDFRVHRNLMLLKMLHLKLPDRRLRRRIKVPTRKFPMYSVKDINWMLR